MRIQLPNTFDDIISAENLLEAWKEFIKGKRAKCDVQWFALHLIDNILQLHSDLAYRTYEHGSYQAFNISDPKPRNIHKATVRDRLLHHAIYRILYPFFARIFIADSYSCQNGKGTHKALNRFRTFSYRVSKNDTRTCWILKGDIRKFFANIDHQVLLTILRQYIPDKDIMWLLEQVIGSFTSTALAKGLPLGNLTSQLFVNIYMNEFDQFIKHRLKAEHYLRYADDFVVFSTDRYWLEQLIAPIQEFLSTRLKLTLHPDKLFIKTLDSGVDFLGWVHFSNHSVFRTVTKRRMLKRIVASPKIATLNSYLGLLKHGNSQKLHAELWRMYLLSQST
jgi:RNA-directed DNA polymerase